MALVTGPGKLFVHGGYGGPACYGDGLNCGAQNFCYLCVTVVTPA